MKKYVLLAVVTFMISVFVGAAVVSAQPKGSRDAAKNASIGRSDPQRPVSKIREFEAIVLARKNGTLAPADPCATSIAITLGTPVNASLGTGDCLRANNTYIDFYHFSGTAGQAISIKEFSNAFDTLLYLLNDSGGTIDMNDDSNGTSDSRIPVDSGVITLPYTGEYFIGANSYGPAVGAYILTLETPAECAPLLVFYNQPVSNPLTTASCAVKINTQPYYTGLYTFYGVAGKQITITMSSQSVDSYLVLHTPTGVGTLQDDDGGGGTAARIPASGTYILPETGRYTIEASTSNAFETGSYLLSLTGPASGTISGRIVTPAGAGLRNGTVSLTDSQGVRRTTTTSSFGFYSFDNVTPGPNYVIRISSRLYRFTPMTIQFNDDLTDLNFTGLE